MLNLDQCWALCCFFGTKSQRSHIGTHKEGKTHYCVDLKPRLTVKLHREHIASMQFHVAALPQLECL